VCLDVLPLLRVIAAAAAPAAAAAAAAAPEHPTRSPVVQHILMRKTTHANMVYPQALLPLPKTPLFWWYFAYVCPEPSWQDDRFDILN
jgi:hypothetical protein